MARSAFVIEVGADLRSDAPRHGTKGTPQGLTDFTREPLFLVHHNGKNLGSIAASAKQGRSLFEAFEMSLQVCSDMKDGGASVSKDVFLETRAKYM